MKSDIIRIPTYLVIGLLSLAIGLMVPGCKESNIDVNEGIDPFSPKPGVPDAYEVDNSTEFARYLNWDAGQGEFAAGGKLSGMTQKHNFHERIDEDWFILETRDDHRAIVVETFDVSPGISTILQVYKKDGSGNLVKFMGTDVTNGASSSTIKCAETDAQTTPANYALAAIPECFDTTGNASLNQQLKLKRQSGPGIVNYYIKITIPPFLFRQGIDTIYYIRARGTGDFLLEVPTNVTATRDIHSDRIQLSWQQSQGATSYRVLRDTSPIAGTVLCDVAAQFPCDTIDDYPSASGTTLVLQNKKQVTASWKKRVDNDDNSPAPPGCDYDQAAGNDTADACDGVLQDVNATVYSDIGTWTQTSNSATNIIECNTDGSLDNEVYQWNQDLNSYRINATGLADSSDPNDYMPTLKADRDTTQNFIDPFPGSISCPSLPFNSNTADDPQVGKIYYYAVYACDEMLEDCKGPSSTSNQANDSSPSGGGSIKINLQTPQLVYASETNDEGIWLAFKDVTSNKATGSDNDRVRYSIRRSESPAGPFDAASEVECQFDNDAAVADPGYKIEFDGASDGTPIDPNKTYYYAIVAQQLRDSGDINMCGASENCIDGDGGTTESRQGTDASRSIDETNEFPDGTPAENDADGDEGCSSDTAYFDLSITSESQPSNVLPGKTRRLQNWAMCLATTDATDTGYVQVVNTEATKQLILTLIDPDAAQVTTVTNYDLVNGSWTNSGRQISDLCTAINALPGPKWSCTTSAANCQNHYGVDNDTGGNLTQLFRDAPAVLLGDTAGQRFVPANDNSHGDEYRSLALESRTFATQGYYGDKIKLRWAPVAEAGEVPATSYSIYRTTNTTTTNVGYLEITYHGNATTANLTLSSNVMSVFLAGQSDQSSNFSIDVANNASYDTMDEVASYLNSLKGFSARIINRQFRIIPSTALNPVSTTSIRLFDERGLAKGYVLSAAGEVPVFNDSDTAYDTVSIAFNEGTAFTYDDNTIPNADSPYHYAIKAFSAGGRGSDFFIPAVGYKRSFDNAVAGQYTNGVNATNAFDSTAACTDSVSPDDCSCGGTNSNPRCEPIGADKDEYDISDMIAADHVSYALAAGQNWMSSSNYGQYEQHDNDTFPKNQEILDNSPVAPAVPHRSGYSFLSKIGVHEPHPMPASDGLCQFDGGFPGTNEGGTDHDHFYLSFGYDGELRQSDSLPCSFRRPGTGTHNSGDTKCFASGDVNAGFKWGGDPDIIYDYGSSTTSSGNHREPLHKVQLTLNSPVDTDWLWFFGMQRYYEYSTYSDYSPQYLPGNSGYIIQNGDDPGCGPWFFEEKTFYGPFRPFSAQGVGSGIPGNTQVPFYSRPCSKNVSSNMTDPDHPSISARTDNGYPGDDTKLGKAYAAKKYSVEYEVDPYNSSLHLASNGAIIVDLYLAWPNLDWYNDTDRAAPFLGAPGVGYQTINGQPGAPDTNPRFAIVPSLDSAPFYSFRLEPGASHAFKLPGSFHVNEYRGIGLLDAPQCNAGAYGGGSTVFNSYTKVTRSASTTSGSSTVTFSSTAQLSAGDPISGTGIPASTFITRVNSTTSVTISNNASATGSPTLTIGGGPCILGPICNKDPNGSVFTKRDDGAGGLTSDCAKLPTSGMVLCDEDTNADRIYDDLAANTTGLGSQTACKPAPFYEPSGSNYYRGTTCSSTASQKTECPPPGMHFLMRAYSPDGNTGRFVLKVTEISPLSSTDTFP